MVRITGPAPAPSSIWAYVVRTLTNPATASDLNNMLVGISGTATGRAANLDNLDMLLSTHHAALTTHDSNLAARETFETAIPATPISGSYGEKIKQMIIRYAIVRGRGSATIAAGAISTIDITPAAGEIWLISALSRADVDGEGRIAEYDGTTEYLGFQHGLSAGRASVWIFSHIIDPSYYLRLTASNPDTVSRTHYYFYSAFKIKSSSIPQAKTIRTKRWYEEFRKSQKKLQHNPSTPSLPPPLDILNKYAFYDPDGDIAIWLEKDVPLELDAEGNVIVKFSQYCKLREFERLFADLIADTTKRPLMTYIRERSVANKMGWEKYIDKWKEEGIEF